MSGRAKRKAAVWALAFVASVTAPCAQQQRFDAEAIKLNNQGVALMGQQFTERAADSFAAAFKKDPKLAQAAINEGIALLAQQKLDEAKECAATGNRYRPEQSPRRGTTWAWRSMRTMSLRVR